MNRDVNSLPIFTRGPDDPVAAWGHVFDDAERPWQFTGCDAAPTTVNPIERQYRAPGRLTWER